MVWISTERVVAARMNNIHPVQTQTNVLIMLVVLVRILVLSDAPCKKYCNHEFLKGMTFLTQWLLTHWQYDSLTLNTLIFDTLTNYTYDFLTHWQKRHMTYYRVAIETIAARWAGLAVQNLAGSWKSYHDISFSCRFLQSLIK